MHLYGKCRHQIFDCYAQKAACAACGLWIPLCLIALIICLAPFHAYGVTLLSDRAQFPASPQGSNLVMQQETEKDLPPISAPYAALSTRSGVELFARSADVERAMASTTKMTTALVVDEAVQSGKLSYSQMITVPQDALVHEASIGLALHDSISLRDTLQGALIHSGNDAAATLALAHSPSITSFADEMNRYVQTKLKLTHTHYVNPHGLDAEGHYSCARDLVVIGAELLRHPQLAAVVRKPEARITINNQPHRIESTFPSALKSSPRVDGIKTGFTDSAGACLVLAAHKDGMGLVACIMDSTLERREREAIALLSWGFDHLPKKTFAVAQQPFATMQVGDRFGWNIHVVYAQSASFHAVPEGEPIYRHWAHIGALPLRSASQPMVCGSVTWKQGDDYLGAVTLTTVGKPFRESARLPWQKDLY